MGVIAYRYEKQFKPHNDVFNSNTIDRVDHVIKIFLARKAVRSIAPEAILVIKNFLNREAYGLDGITNSVIKILPIKYATFLANFINTIFPFWHFLSSRKHGVIIPMKEPGEDLALLQAHNFASCNG